MQTQYWKQGRVGYAVRLMLSVHEKVILSSSMLLFVEVAHNCSRTGPRKGGSSPKAQGMNKLDMVGPYPVFWLTTTMNGAGGGALPVGAAAILQLGADLQSRGEMGLDPSEYDDVHSSPGGGLLCALASLVSPAAVAEHSSPARRVCCAELDAMSILLTLNPADA